MLTLEERKIWALSSKTKILLHVNNKGADQPAHLSSQISIFVIHFMGSTIAKLATCKYSIL